MQKNEVKKSYLATVQSNSEIFTKKVDENKAFLNRKQQEKQGIQAAISLHTCVAYAPHLNGSRATLVSRQLHTCVEQRFDLIKTPFQQAKPHFNNSFSPFSTPKTNKIHAKTKEMKITTVSKKSIYLTKRTIINDYSFKMHFIHRVKNCFK